MARPPGLAVACCTRGSAAPVLIRPEGGWSRAAILDWLRAQADRGTRMLIGLDLSPAFPFCDEGDYFPGWHRSPADAASLWALVDRMCAADPDLSATSFVAAPEPARHFRQLRARGDLFPAGRGRYRVCEWGQVAMGLVPTSCFNLVGAAQVGKSSLTGMRVLHRLRGQVPVWPFDPLPPDGPVLVEIYTTIAARAAGIRKGRSKMRDGVSLDAALAALGGDPHLPLGRYDDHATDAILTAAWLRAVVDRPALWSPAGMTPAIARTEGWTFGVG